MHCRNCDADETRLAMSVGEAVLARRYRSEGGSDAEAERPRRRRSLPGKLRATACNVPRTPGMSPGLDLVDFEGHHCQVLERYEDGAILLRVPTDPVEVVRVPAWWQPLAPVTPDQARAVVKALGMY